MTVSHAPANRVKFTAFPQSCSENKWRRVRLKDSRELISHGGCQPTIPSVKKPFHDRRLRDLIRRKDNSGSPGGGRHSRSAHRMQISPPPWRARPWESPSRRASSYSQAANASNQMQPDYCGVPCPRQSRQALPRRTQAPRVSLFRLIGSSLTTWFPVRRCGI